MLKKHLASILFIDFCASATTFPRDILRTAKTVNSNFHCVSKALKHPTNILIASAKPAALEPTDKKATTGVGEPS